jgi:hypothetical protein
MLLGMSFGVATGVAGVDNEGGEGLERSLDRSGTSLGSGEGAGDAATSTHRHPVTHRHPSNADAICELYCLLLHSSHAETCDT